MKRTIVSCAMLLCGFTSVIWLLKSLNTTIRVYMIWEYMCISIQWILLHKTSQIRGLNALCRLKVIQKKNLQEFPALLSICINMYTAKWNCNRNSIKLHTIENLINSKHKTRQNWDHHFMKSVSKMYEFKIHE